MSKTQTKQNNIRKNLGRILTALFFCGGLLFGGWSPIVILLGYWMEEAITGLFTFAFFTGVNVRRRQLRDTFMYAFIYGVFFFGHTIFVLIITGISSDKAPAARQIFEGFMGMLGGRSFYLEQGLGQELGLTLLVICASVLYTLFRKIRTTRKPEDGGVDADTIANQSFGALILPHFIIIFGVAGIVLTGAPGALTVALVAVKLLLEMSGFADKGSPIFGKKDNNR